MPTPESRTMRRAVPVVVIQLQSIIRLYDFVWLRRGIVSRLQPVSRSFVGWSILGNSKGNETLVFDRLRAVRYINISPRPAGEFMGPRSRPACMHNVRLSGWDSKPESDLLSPYDRTGTCTR